jgi:hypothetical protein
LHETVLLTDGSYAPREVYETERRRAREHLDAQDASIIAALKATIKDFERERRDHRSAARAAHTAYAELDVASVVPHELDAAHRAVVEAIRGACVAEGAIASQKHLIEEAESRLRAGGSSCPSTTTEIRIPRPWGPRCNASPRLRSRTRSRIDWGATRRNVACND